MRSALTDYIRVYDEALEPALCARMVDSFGALSRFHRGNGRGARAGLDDSRWTELDIGQFSDPAFRAMLSANMARHLARYNDDTALSLPLREAEHTSELILKRYRPGGDERFQPHFDSLGAVSNRYLVFLWYLNDVDEGGDTEFVDLGLRVAPRAGRLLMFPPYWMFQHAGRAPVSGDKYILSTYYLF